MRRFIFVLTAFLMSGPAAAQNWKEYSYPDYSFAVSFPADPRIESAVHPVASDRSVAARTYLVRQDDNLFKVTVADLTDAHLEEAAVLDYATKMLSAGGEVKVNIPHRINRVYGRQLSIAWADGSRAMAAVFDYNGRLYQIEGKAPGGSDSLASIIRFQQSLIFTDRGSNRSPDAIRALQEACRGTVVAAPNNPAGADDPRCRRRAPQ